MDTEAILNSLPSDLKLLYTLIQGEFQDLKHFTENRVEVLRKLAVVVGTGSVQACGFFARDSKMASATLAFPKHLVVNASTIVTLSSPLFERSFTTSAKYYASIKCDCAYIVFERGIEGSGVPCVGSSKKPKLGEKFVVYTPLSKEISVGTGEYIGRCAASGAHLAYNDPSTEFYVISMKSVKGFSGALATNGSGLIGYVVGNKQFYDSRTTIYPITIPPMALKDIQEVSDFKLSVEARYDKCMKEFVEQSLEFTLVLPMQDIICDSDAVKYMFDVNVQIVKGDPYP